MLGDAFIVSGKMEKTNAFTGKGQKITLEGGREKHCFHWKEGRNIMLSLKRGENGLSLEGGE